MIYSNATMNALATYIHHLNPILVEIPGTPLALRWYGLAYVAGFVLGYLVLLQLSKKKLYCVEPDKLGDFITAVCIFGVLMGGRLGEFFFYWLPREGWSGLCADPFWVLRVWEGGMASHGGILAVLLVGIWYARKHRHSIPALVDGLAIVAPIGICFGRIANFINGELYGRITTADNPIAMKFPMEMASLPLEQQLAAVQAMEQAAGAPLPRQGFYDAMLQLCRENESVREALGQFLNPRYPSQLFEAAGEGLIIFIVLMTLRLKWKEAPAGIFCSLFCFLYAAARIGSECFKEPDADVWHGITQGQYLSFGVILLGILFLIPTIRNYNAKKLQKI